MNIPFVTTEEKQPMTVQILTFGKKEADEPVEVELPVNPPLDR